MSLTYSDYLGLPTLLSLQETRVPLAAGPEVALSEHFFIVAHQSCELWLKQLIADLARSAVVLELAAGPGNLEVAVDLLTRADTVMTVLHQQLLALERLPPLHFAEFRPWLDSASGAESRQFRQLGRLLGDGKGPPRLWEGFRAAAARAGTSVEEVCRRGPAAGVHHRVAELLLDVGNGYWRWKVAHLSLVSRLLDGQAGTAGTTGASYLAGRIALPFPELRRLRGRTHDPLAARTEG